MLNSSQLLMLDTCLKFTSIFKKNPELTIKTDLETVPGQVCESTQSGGAKHLSGG